MKRTNTARSISRGRGEMTRKVTNQILEAVDDGLLDPKQALLAALKYMSEDEVADMARINELLFDEEVEGE